MSSSPSGPNEPRASLWASLKQELAKASAQPGRPELARRIVARVQQAIEQGWLRAGDVVPSVRALARMLDVSHYTIASAFEQLTHNQCLVARRGSGYYVRLAPPPTPVLNPASPPTHTPKQLPGTWLSSEVYQYAGALLPVGAGLLPEDHKANELLREALRRLGRAPLPEPLHYGVPQGLPELREAIAMRHSGALRRTNADQVLTTFGASHAFELILRRYAKPGDTLLVEEPGYQNLLALLQQSGCQLVGVPRSAEGLDLAALDELARRHRPRMLFVTSVLDNPLGVSLDAQQAHQILSCAERHDFLVVENDSHRALAADPQVSLAALDGLNRVLCVTSFSKSLSPKLRVGAILASRARIEALTTAKMVQGLTTSEITERLALMALTSQGFTRHLDALRTYLDRCRAATLKRLAAWGMEPLNVPLGGLFVCAGWPVREVTKSSGKRASQALDVSQRGDRSMALAQEALQHGIAMAPGQMFCLTPASQTWFRFNVAYTDDPRLDRFMRKVAQEHGVI